MIQGVTLQWLNEVKIIGDKVKKCERTSGLYKWTIKSSRKIAEVIVERKAKSGAKVLSE